MASTGSNPIPNDFFYSSFLLIGQGDAESVVNAEENPGETCELADSVDKWHYVKL